VMTFNWNWCSMCVGTWPDIVDTERIKMPKRGVYWAFLKFIARTKSY
jgi:hypothetical protein